MSIATGMFLDRSHKGSVPPSMSLWKDSIGHRQSTHPSSLSMRFLAPISHEAPGSDECQSTGVS